LIRRNLPDLNVLIALTDSEHDHHHKARAWFSSSGKENWGLCPLTEAGFIRVTANPAMHAGARGLEQSIAILQALKGLPGHFYCGINSSWVDLTARFAPRISGHQQVTDAYLLGLAIENDGVLVTFDRGLRYLAGPEFSSRNLLVLE
jgi:toxin-antitoxin system PIN domain toxin